MESVLTKTRVPMETWLTFTTTPRTNWTPRPGTTAPRASESNDLVLAVQHGHARLPRATLVSRQRLGLCGHLAALARAPMNPQPTSPLASPRRGAAVGTASGRMAPKR